MRKSTKSQLSSFAILLAIGVLSIFLLVAMNFLAWPVGQEVGKIATINPIPAKVPDGVLLVTVLSNQSIAGNSGANGSSVVSEPFPGLSVAVSLGLDTPFVTNRTTDTGQIEENVAPDTYAIKILDWRLNNFTTSVAVLSNEITSLTITLNATSYLVQEFHVQDPDSVGLIVGWEQVYVHLDSTAPAAPQNSNVYLDTQFSPETPITSMTNSRTVTSVTVASEQSGNVSQWVQLNVKAPLNIGAIKTLSLLDLQTTYAVNTTAIQ